MNSTDLAEVRRTLWAAADELRANSALAPNEYRGPVLGLIFLARARIAVHDGLEICRLDVARSSQPVRARTTKAENAFFVRMNNSTRELPDAERGGYIRDRWPGEQEIS